MDAVIQWVIGLGVTIFLGMIGWLIDRLTNTFNFNMEELSKDIKELSSKLNMLNINFTKQNEKLENIEDDLSDATNRINGYSLRLKSCENEVLILKTEHSRNHGKS